MADIRLNLIADLGAFQGALATAVTEAKKTQAQIGLGVDTKALNTSLRAVNTLLGQKIKSQRNINISLTGITNVTKALNTLDDRLSKYTKKIKPELDASGLKAQLKKEFEKGSIEFSVRANEQSINASAKQIQDRFNRLVGGSGPSAGKLAFQAKFAVAPNLTSVAQAKTAIQAKLNELGAVSIKAELSGLATSGIANDVKSVQRQLDSLFSSRTITTAIDKTIAGLDDAVSALDRAFSNRSVSVGIDRTVQGLNDVAKALDAAFGDRTISIVVNETIRGLQDAKAVLASTFGDQLVNVVVNASDNVTAALEAIEAKIASLLALPAIRPTTDLAELILLNKELDSKQSHLDRVVADFNSKVIKPNVDTSELDRLKREFSAAQAEVASIAKTGGTPAKPYTASANSTAMLKSLIEKGRPNMMRPGYEYIAGQLDVPFKAKQSIESIKAPLLEKAESAGNDIAAGILYGLYENTSDVERGSKALGEKTLAAIKKFLEIRSPSGKAEDEVGKPFAQGTGIGIDQNSDVAEKAAERMGQSMIDRLKATIKKGLASVGNTIQSSLDRYAMEAAKKLPESALGASVSREEARLFGETYTARRDNTAKLRSYAAGVMGARVNPEDAILRKNISSEEAALFNESYTARQDNTRKLRQEAASTLSGAIGTMRSMSELNAKAQELRLKQERSDRVAEARRRRDMLRSITDEEVALFNEVSAGLTMYRQPIGPVNTPKILGAASKFEPFSLIASQLGQVVKPVTRSQAQQPPRGIPLLPPSRGGATQYEQPIGPVDPRSILEAASKFEAFSLATSRLGQVFKPARGAAQQSIFPGIPLLPPSKTLTATKAAQEEALNLSKAFDLVSDSMKRAASQADAALKNRLAKASTTALTASNILFDAQGRAIKKPAGGGVAGQTGIPPMNLLPGAGRKYGIALAGRQEGITGRAAGSFMANPESRVAYVKPEFLRFIREAAKAAPQLVQGVSTETVKRLVSAQAGAGSYRMAQAEFGQQTIPVGRTLALPPSKLGNLTMEIAKQASGISDAFRLINQSIARSAAKEAQVTNQQRLGASPQAQMQALQSMFASSKIMDAIGIAQRAQYEATSRRNDVLRGGAGEGFATLGIEQTGGIDQNKKALAQISAAYRAGVVSANDYARAQIQVAKATLDAKLPFKGLSDAVKDLGSQFGEAARDILFYGAAYQALGALQQLPRNIYEAVKAQDSFSNTLKASLGAGDTFGQQMQYLSDLSAKYGMNLAETRDGFVKMFSSLRQANIATTDVNTLQESVAILGTAFKMSPDKLDRVTYALGQMASKGQITAEELKGQLGDVLPGAVSQFAEAAGYKGPDAIAKFSKAMEDGAFKGKAMQDILYNWALIVNRDFANAALNGKNSIQGLENQLANANTRMLESFRGGLAQVLPSIVNPLVAGLNQVSDALDLVFQNSKQRMQQLKQNQSQLQQAQKTGIAPADNLELGFRKGERVSKSDVANQLKQTEVQIDAVRLKLDGLEDNKAAQKLAQDFRNFGAAVKGFADGLSAAFSPLQKVVQSLVSISNAITGASASTSGFVGLLVGTILQVRLASGIIGFLASRFLGLVAVTKTTGTVFVGLSAVLNRVGLSFGLLNGSVTAFGLAAARGGIQARFLAAGLNLVAKAGPLLLVSGLIFFFEKIGELLDKNAKKVREFKDAIAGLGATELMSRKATLSAQLSTQKAAFANYPGGYEGYVADRRAGRNPATRIGRTQAEGLTQAAENISVTVSQLGEIENALIRDRRQQAAIRAEQQASMRDVQASMAAAEGEGKGKGKGKGGGTPQAIGDDFARMMQDLQSKTIKAQLEEQKYIFQNAIQRLFPRDAGIFQPFVDAYKGVFEFLNDFQERQLNEMESATKTAVGLFRLDQQNNRNQARGLAAPIQRSQIRSWDSPGQRFGGPRGHQGYDIGADPGTAVAAMASGTVKEIYKNFNRTGAYGGKGLVIQGDDGVTYVYGHVEGITVGVGSKVTAGQKIAAVADLGNQSHLHQEMRRNGVPFDPRKIIQDLYAGRAVSQGQGSMAATTLTAEQKSQLKQAEQNLAAQQQRTTKALLDMGVQGIRNLVDETNLADNSFSQVSKSLRDLRNRVQDLELTARRAFLNLLPSGVAESSKSILDAEVKLVEARRQQGDVLREFNQMSQQGGGIMELFSVGRQALTNPQYKDQVSRINATLAAGGSTETVSSLFEKAGGNAQKLLAIVKELAPAAQLFTDVLVKAAEAELTLAKGIAPLTDQIELLQSQRGLQESAGIPTVALDSAIRELEIRKQIMSIQAAMPMANAEQAAFYRQLIANLETASTLNQTTFNGFETLGGFTKTLSSNLRDVFNEIGTGFAEAIVQGTSFWDVLQQGAASFFTAMGKYLVDLAAQQAAAGIVSFIGKLFSFGGGIDFGGGAVGNALQAGGPSSLIANASLGMAANGAVWKGGWTPIQAFANGGLVSSPTLGLVGEGRYNEAIVPLPDGRSIPVQLQGNDPFAQNRSAMAGTPFTRDNTASAIERSLAAQEGTTINNSDGSITVSGGAGSVAYNFQTTRVLGEDLVTTDQLVAATTMARKEGATQGARLALEKLRQSPQARRSIGI